MILMILMILTFETFDEGNFWWEVNMPEEGVEPSRGVNPVGF